MNDSEKLAALKGVEEELGVDLLTLYKAFKYGIWSKGGFYDPCLKSEPHFINPIALELGTQEYVEKEHDDDDDFSVDEDDALCLYSRNYDNPVYVVRIKDYGRTWALTEGELK